MATSRRGRRRIVVEGETYFWKDDRHRISVCTEGAFTPGQHGRWLRFTLPEAAPVCAALGDAYVRELEAAPRTIARVIAYARRHHGLGDPALVRDVALEAAAVVRALAMTLDELIDENLRLATAALDSAEGWRLHAPFWDLERLVRAAPGAQVHVDDWLACNAERLRAHAAVIAQGQTYLRACCATLQIGLEP